MTTRRSLRWWQFGLIGGGVLSVATAVRFVRALAAGLAGEVSVGEAVGFPLFIFGMGFVSGLIVWDGRRLYRRIGLAGDGVVGAVVLVVFFVACMAVFDLDLLLTKFVYGGLPMLGLAVVIGTVAGAWIGRDVRKQFAAGQPPPPNLNRFVQAQQEDYPVALGELRRGRKESHWMWYIFPQYAGLGHSTMAQTEWHFLSE